MDLPEPVVDRLARLAPDQRAAAMAPLGPVLCVAPAGSGKTTTLVARIAWLAATGVPPDQIAAITFNRKAAQELAERLGAALAWMDGAASSPGEAGATHGVRVRTFHALGLEILRDSQGGLARLADRGTVIRTAGLAADRASIGRLDAAFSRLKLDLDVDADAVAADAQAGPMARAFVVYERALARAGAIDLDDLVRLALRRLRDDEALLARWRKRCEHLLVDETQDVDRAQLELALLLAAPGNRVFFVGDDDQSIYGWRLADVRRVLGLAARLPGLRRIDLEVNYRCPAPVLERAVRLVERNEERFAKVIRAGPSATGRLVLAPDASDDTERARRILAGWDATEGTWAILARTNRDLLPAAAVALELGVPFRAPGLRLLLDEPAMDEALTLLTASGDGRPLLAHLEATRRAVTMATAGRLDAERATAVAAVDSPRPLAADSPTEPPLDDDTAETALSVAELLGAMLGWAAGYGGIVAFLAAVRAARERLGTLRREDARLTLATAHATKGLEFDHVAVVGLDAGRFPSARSLADADDPVRALEEERRLGYVAWTRARRSLTLVYDPVAPSPFMLEAFTREELGLA